MFEWLVRLLNVNFDMGVVPMDWRGACIVPLYKGKGGKCECSNIMYFFVGGPVSLVPVLHLLPPSTPVMPYDTHPFFPHAQTISILSDQVYSLTPFLLKLFYAPLHF